MPESTGFDWGDAFGAALSWYMNNQNQKTPNQYPVQLTPEQKYWDDAKKKLYEAGGSDQMKSLTGAANQYLSQIPGTVSNHSFMSPYMKNQSFAGGVKIPTFDPSKFGPTQPSTPTPPVPSGQTPVPDTERKYPSVSPEGGDARPAFGFGQNMISPADQEKMAAAWDKYKQSNPNWRQDGVKAALTALGALTGVGGSLLMRALKWLLFREVRSPAAAGPKQGTPGMPGESVEEDSPLIDPVRAGGGMTPAPWFGRQFQPPLDKIEDSVPSGSVELDWTFGGIVPPRGKP